MNLSNINTIKEQILTHTGISVIGARPGLGKTALSLQLASEFSIFEDINLVFFSLEMSSQSIRKRLMTMGLSAENINILDPFGFHFSEADILNVISPNKKTIVMIDYYQLLDCSLKKNLYAIIKDRNMHLILNTLLTRAVDYLPKGKPTLEFYKEWADKGYLIPLEQANIIAFLWGKYKCERGIDFAHEFDISDEREIIIAKNDFGENGIIKSYWNPERLLYEFPAE